MRWEAPPTLPGEEGTVNPDRHLTGKMEGYQLRQTGFSVTVRVACYQANCTNDAVQANPRVVEEHSKYIVQWVPVCETCACDWFTDDEDLRPLGVVTIPGV